MRTAYTRCGATLLLAGLLAAATACGERGSGQAGGGAAREIQLAPGAPAQPQLNDAPAPAAAPARATAREREARPRRGAKPVERATAPAPEAEKVVVRPLNAEDRAEVAASPVPATVSVPGAPVATAPSEPAMGTVSAGSSFAVRPVARVCTNTFKPGDRFTATVDEPVTGSDGAVIPTGSSVVLKVDESTRSINSNDSLRLTFSVVSLRIGRQSYDVTGHVSQTTPLEKVRVQSTTDQAKKVGAGALIGALAGQLLGKDTRSTVLGGAVGAAAGAAVAVGTADYDGCVPKASALTVTLDAPLQVLVRRD